MRRGKMKYERRRRRRRGQRAGGEGLMSHYGEEVSDHQQREHGLSHVKSMSPVVVGDPPVAFTQRVNEPHQSLQTSHTRYSFL